MTRMNVKVPKELVNTAKLRRAVENALTGEAKAVKVDLSVTTQTWKHKPAFTIEDSPGRRVVATDDEIYDFVDSGTPPHIITAKGPGSLVFGVGGRAKTTPRVIGSKAGGKGSTIVRARTVHHPGTAPREFTDTIRDKWDDRLSDVLQRAIDSEV
jgi:hypothetical protein